MNPFLLFISLPNPPIKNVKAIFRLCYIDICLQIMLHTCRFSHLFKMNLSLQELETDLYIKVIVIVTTCICLLYPIKDTDFDSEFTNSAFELELKLFTVSNCKEKHTHILYKIPTMIVPVLHTYTQ